MGKYIINFISSLFSRWIFSPGGVVICSALWGSVMTGLTYMTDYLSIFAPLSYGVAFSLFSLLGLIFFRLFNSITENIKTKKTTFIQYDFSSGVIGLSKTSNIEDQRTFSFEKLFVFYFTFKKPIIPSSVIHMEAIRGSLPSIDRQYVSSKGACLFLKAESIDHNCAFRAIFNKDYESN